MRRSVRSIPRVILRLKPGRWLTLPPRLRRRLQWSVGDALSFCLQGDRRLIWRQLSARTVPVRRLKARIGAGAWWLHGTRVDSIDWAERVVAVCRAPGKAARHKEEADTRHRPSGRTASSVACGTVPEKPTGSVPADQIYGGNKCS